MATETPIETAASPEITETAAGTGAATPAPAAPAIPLPDPAAIATFTGTLAETPAAPPPVVVAPTGPSQAQVGQLILELTLLVAEAPGLLTGEISLATYCSHCEIIMKSVTKIFQLEN